MNDERWKEESSDIKKYICKTLKLWITFVPFVEKKKKSYKNRMQRNLVFSEAMQSSSKPEEWEGHPKKIGHIRDYYQLTGVLKRQAGIGRTGREGTDIPG